MRTWNCRDKLIEAELLYTAGATGKLLLARFCSNSGLLRQRADTPLLTACLHQVMSAPRGQVVWSAAQTPDDLPEHAGLEPVSFAENGEPEDLDRDGGEELVRSFPHVAIVFGSGQPSGDGTLSVTSRYQSFSVGLKGPGLALMPAASKLA